MTPQDYLATCAKDCNVLYYPGSGTDLGPFNLFADSSGITHAIYADYMVTDSEAQTFLQSIPGWTCSNLEHMEPNDFGVKSWAELWYRHPASHQFAKPDHAYAIVAHLFREGRMVKFYFMGTEAIGTYSRLPAAGLLPDLVVLQDHGFGCNWSGATFGGKGYLFDQAIRGNAMPQLLLVAENTDPWPGYQAMSTSAVHRGQSNEGHARAIYRLVDPQP